MPAVVKGARPVVLAALASFGLAVPVVAQGGPKPAPDPEILQTVQRLFDAMRARDTVALRAVIDSSARVVTTTTREGRPVMRVASIDRFVASVGTATQSLDERIFEPDVRQDDNLATVWTRYTFYVGTQLSHCGYDAFQLFRSEAGWKVIHIADTQRREGCAP
ncbi:MAG: hypothetical protein ACRDHF_01465 [Tepidiformaceae bacterium]